MSRQRKPKAVILPPELDDDADEEHGSVMPDDDGWITLEGDNGDGKQSRRDPGDGGTEAEPRLVRKPTARRKKRAAGDS